MNTAECPEGNSILKFKGFFVILSCLQLLALGMQLSRRSTSRSVL